MFNDEQDKFMSELWLQVYAASLMSEDYDHVHCPEKHARNAVIEYKKQYHAGLFKV